MSQQFYGRSGGYTIGGIDTKTYESVNREIEFDDMGPGRSQDILLIRRLTALSTDHIA